MDECRDIARRLDEGEAAGEAADCGLLLKLARGLIQHGIANSDLFNGMEGGDGDDDDDDEQGEYEDEEGDEDGDDDNDNDNDNANDVDVDVDVDDEGEGIGAQPTVNTKFYQFDLEEEEDLDDDEESGAEDEEEEFRFSDYVDGDPFENALVVLQRGEEIAQGEMLVDVYKLMGEAYAEVGAEDDSINCYKRAIEVIESRESGERDLTKQIEILERLSQNLKLSAEVSADKKLEIANKLKGYLEKQLSQDKDDETNLARLEEVKLDIREIKMEKEMEQSGNSKELLKNLILTQMAKLDPLKGKRKAVNDLSGMIVKKKK